ncbi:uncharacterized protein LOC128192810 isoform X2 [Crassostrea angulata]|uniref:uncharacterized protein LOC128192810 isoform X2 n=1 Tax=Magallana angulata TaxID=2784310 RepID=UPI0022B0BFDA|nr:uncharacterized protein LOC128192810 isoform X2 [Crassostrea angulata]
MGNTFKTEARKPSNKKNDINQQQQKRMKVKPKEQLSLTSEGVSHVNVDKLPQHWKHHAGEEPFSLRDDLKWFSNLLAAYKQQKHHILEFLSKSNFEEETPRCPDDMDDKAFDDFARECTETTFEIPSSWNKITMKQNLHGYIKMCLEKKWTLIKLGPVLEEHNRLKLEVQNLTEKNIELQTLRAKEQEDTKRQKKISIKDLKRVNDEIEQEREKVRYLQQQLRPMKEEKENLLTRLSKLAGPKMTSKNPDIADLNDDNRPTKLAEKFGQLYDDAWTDSMEELTGVETRLNDREAISFLLRIVMTAYQFCSGPRSLFLDLTDCQTIMLCEDTSSMKAFTKLPDAITPDIQQATKNCLRSKELSLTLQKEFADILNGLIIDMTKREENHISNERNMNKFGLVKEEAGINKPSDYCLHNIRTAHLQSRGIADYSKSTKKSKKPRKKVAQYKSAASLQPYHEQCSRKKCIMVKKHFWGQLDVFTVIQTSSSPQFAKTTHFAERCVELCWFMQTTRPPIHLSAHIPDDGRMNNDILSAYMKSGTEVDYIVWPVMYLYENGPVLNKGIAQPK